MGKIIEGKVYVGTSINGEVNVHVTNFEKDKIEVLFEDLSVENVPLSIKYDGNGDITLTYIKGVNFQGVEGDAFKYNILRKKY